MTAGSHTMQRGLAAAFADTVRVTIKDLGFLPAAITVHVSDTVEWINTDLIAHTATAMNGECDVAIEAHTGGRLTISKPGMVQYFCQFHRNMMATMVVLAK